MSTIASVRLPAGWRPADLWPELARQSLAWLRGQQLNPRDAVLLLPFVGLLEPARAAFAALGGWQPRVETPQTLAASLAPPRAPASGQCSGDAVLDRLIAAQMLRQHSWGGAWAVRDPAGFSALVDALVEASQALRESAACHAPGERAAWWARVRQALSEPGAAAGIEALLLQVAAAWAEAGAEPATDVLFSHRPAAWLALRLGGIDPLAEALLQQAGSAALLLDADGEAPLQAVAASAAVQRTLCDDFESEAQATAQAVIDALNTGAAPLALVALDRELLRRVRALLDRAQVPVIDETGWKLATTAAAARLLAPLQAALPGATQDDQLRWLKTWPRADAEALRALEARWRQRRQKGPAAAADALWAQAQQHLAPLREPRVLPLAQWLQRLAALLQEDGTMAALQAERDGAQALAAIGLPQPEGAPWQHATGTLRLNLHEFVAWVRDTLEQVNFLPLPHAGALVRITPLARAYGRGFAQVVMPATDHQHLGHEGPPRGLIGDALATRLGLPDAATRRHRQRVALAHALRADAVHLLRRRRNEQEPLAESPLLQWLQALREQQGLPPWPEAPWQPAWRPVAPAPVPRPLPTAGPLLPALLSASQLEALRQCPYRFFARAVLGLDEPEELEAALAKRDYGNWLHLLLHRFHSERVPGGDDAAELERAAAFATQELQLDAGELLPFAASFERLAPAYLAWLQAREAAGWFWADGESDHRIAPEELAGLKLRGRLDRIDHGPDGARQIIDYKTGDATALRRKVREPLEDTQLAFYAALLGADAALKAAYLALDGETPELIEHEGVHDTAATLLAALGGEWQRLREGEPMPALGEGTVCDTCEARGLCRRDQWAPEARP
jgi:ATP-dependent helicase/nuclease subunit B